MIDDKVIEKVIEAVSTACIFAPRPEYARIDACIDILISELGNFVSATSRWLAAYHRSVVLSLWGNIYDSVMSELEKMRDNRTAQIFMFLFDIANEAIKSIIETKDDELVLTDVAYLEGNRSEDVDGGEEKR